MSWIPDDFGEYGFACADWRTCTSKRTPIEAQAFNARRLRHCDNGHPMHVEVTRDEWWGRWMEAAGQP